MYDPLPSYRASILALKVGESYCRAHRLDGNKATKRAITATRDTIRNTMNAAVSRARLSTEAQFTVEAAEIRTRSMDVLLLVAVTRIV